MDTTTGKTVMPAFRIEEGFTVRDATNTDVGSVKSFRFSDDIPGTSVSEAATPAGSTDTRPRDIVTSMIDVFADDTTMPQELRENLLQHGFIRVRQGLLQSDLFATMDQVARVADNTVFLKAHKDDLVSL
jgi:hypothetical protein